MKIQIIKVNGVEIALISSNETIHLGLASEASEIRE